MDFTEQIKRAYKKMKASVYYDKTQVVLRNNMVKFEANGIINMETDFANISKKLNGPEDEWYKYEKEILDSVKTLTFPKKLKKPSNSIIFNDSGDSIEVDVEGEQYFINMEVQGHLLGVLWVMYIGKYIDKDLYECCYGNRLTDKLFAEENGTCKLSNSLFKPYYTQYENWRDYGLEKAQEQLKLSKDAIILTLDFKRFFYTVNFEEKDFDKYYEKYIEKFGNDNERVEENIIIERINKFVYKVLVKFSSLFQNKFENRVFLPIGFFPSNILSNAYLDTFDSNISTRWNPLYYGRYVDDIIIVDKVEKNSKLFKLVGKNDVNQKDILEYFLCKCNADKENECHKEEYLLKENGNTYFVNNKFLYNEKGKIEVQKDKVKVFYFRYNSSNALIEKFKKSIAINRSEFRYMPEDNSILEDGDYSEIYNLEYAESINKLSDVTGVVVDKYGLSKFLGKYLRVGGIINDKRESLFIEDILKIFDERVIIENYTLWDKVIEILIINENYSVLINFIELLLSSILNLKYKPIKKTRSMVSSLLEVLYAGLCRGFALNWGKKSKECIENICKLVCLKNIKSTKKVVKKFNYNEILKVRRGYCITRMLDKNIMPALIDLIIESEDFIPFTDANELNLSKYQQFVDYIKKFEYNFVNYYYYPYTISPQDIQMGSIICDIKAEKNLRSPDEMIKLVNQNYYKLNYNNCFDKNSMIEIDSKKIMKTDYFNGYGISINSEVNFRKDKLKVALANVKVKEEDFIDVLTNVPCRSYERYKNLAAVVREAVRNKVDMLIFPESYLPIEWLPILMSISVRTKMAIITGIEHVASGKKVYNLTATILPFQHEDYKHAYINMHSKVVFSPEERFTIEGYRYQCQEGNTYELFEWNNIWFTVYCCFEVASIRTRAMFQSIPDLIITIEWNHDINYYNNIIESLSRDLHCFCIQVNTSDYGDSRLIKPSKTENKDIIRIKGGINGTAILDEINIKALRDFQMKKYNLQKMDKSFKPTPPFFSSEIVNKKRKGKLWKDIEKELKKYYDTNN